MLTIILVVLLILVLFGAIPAYRRSPVYGGGVGLVGLILIVLLILVLMGRI